MKKNFHIEVCGIHDQCLTLSSMVCGRAIIDEYSTYGSQDYTLFCVIRGSKDITIGNTNFNLKPGRCLLLPPEITAQFVEDHHTIEMLYISFNGFAVNMYVNRCGINPKNPIFKDKDHKVRKSLMYIEQKSKLPTNQYCTIASTMYQLFSDILEIKLALVSEHKYDRQHYYSLKAIEYIDMHYCDGILIKDIANFLGINSGYFSKLFIDRIGIHPQDFILCKRLEKAAILLENDEMLIQDISNQVGYKNTSSFSTTFNEKTHMSPRQYRNLSKAKKITPYRPFSELLLIRKDYNS